jgi:hypothetical protein
LEYRARGFAGDDPVEAFRHFALITIARDAGFVALATVTLMVAFSFKLALALCVGATIQLLFAFWLLLRDATVDESRIARTEPWRILKAHERPVGEAGRCNACHDLHLVLRHFAKAAAAAAILLYSSAIVFGLRASWQATGAMAGQALD